MKAFQDYYSGAYSHCYGCGTENAYGLKLKSYWQNDDPTSNTTIAHFLPDKRYTGGYPDNVYGGLIASILDCHGNGTASAAGYRHFGRSLGSQPILRYVTANLNINFLAPVPIGEWLELRAVIEEVTDRKVVMRLELWATQSLKVKGSMTSVLLPSK